MVIAYGIASLFVVSGVALWWYAVAMDRDRRYNRNALLDLAFILVFVGVIYLGGLVVFLSN